MIIEALSLLLGLAFMSLLVVGFARRPEIAVPIVLLIELTNNRYRLPTVSIGSLAIYASDLATIALLAATALRPILRVRRRQISGPLLLLVVLTLLGFARGYRAFGLQTAGNNAREMLAFGAAALFFSTVVITPEFVATLRRWFTIASLVLFAITAVFLLQNGFGSYSIDGQRSLDSRDALVLMFAIVIAVVIPYGRTRTRNLAFPVVGALVLIISLQRSVVLAGAVALIVIVLFGGRARTRRSSRSTRFLIATGGLAVAVLILAGPTGLDQDFGTAVETSTIQGGTFNWRLEGWQILVERQITGSTPNLMVGNPAGTGSARVIEGELVQVAPHSHYVSLLQSVGVVGLGVMIWLLVATFRRNVVNLRSTLTFTATVGLLFAALLAALSTFFVSYSVGIVGGLVVGLAVSLAWFGARDPEAEQQETQPTESLGSEEDPRALLRASE